MIAAATSSLQEWRNRLKFFLAADLIDAANPYIPGEPHEQAASLALAGHPSRILDLCGGTGYAARLLTRRDPGVHVDVLDASAEMLDAGRRRLPADLVGRVEMHLGDAGALTFPDHTFDVVMATFALHELPTEVRRSAIREAARVLAPGGAFVVADLDYGRPHTPLHDLYLWLAERAHAREVLGDGLVRPIAAELEILSHRPNLGSLLPFQLIDARKHSRREPRS